LEDKIIKKQRKNTLKWFLFILILLVTIVIVTVNLSVFQSFLGNRVSTIVTNEIKTPFRVEKIKLGYFLRIEMKNVQALDEYYDTLLKADKISFRLSEINRESKIIRFNDFSAQKLDFHLIKHKGDSQMNINYITDRLKDTTSNDSWDFEFIDMALSNSRFRLDNYNEDYQPDQMDYNHLDVKNLDAQIQNLGVINDTISAWVRSLDAVEQSGFYLDEMEAHLKISSTGWKWDFVRIETPRSKLFLDFVFDYNDYKELSDFVDKVNLSAKLHDCQISMADMQYFIPGLTEVENSVEISGDIEGRISDIKSRQLVMKYGKETRFLGNFAVKGLPQVEGSYFDAEIKKFTTTANDLQSLRLGKNDTLLLPEPLNKLTKIELTGDFKGKPLEFTSSSKLNTNLGNLSANIKMTKDTSGTPTYEGSLTGDSLLLGAITKRPEDFGSMNFHTTIEGKGFGKGIEARLNGYANHLHFRGNTFDSLTIHGEATSDRFSGQLKLRDDILSFDFSGMADMSKEHRWFDFSSSIHHADLNKLKIPNKSDSLSKISATINADFSGNHLDSLSGYARLTDLNYHQDNFVYRLDSLVVKAHQDPLTKEIIEIRSDFMDANIEGRFHLSRLAESYKNLMHHYLPEVFAYDSIEKLKQDFNFDFHLKDTRGISQIFLPSVRLSEDSYIQGRYSSDTNEIFMEARLDTLTYNSIKFQEVNVSSFNGDDLYNSIINVKQIILKEYEEKNIESVGLEQFELSTRIREGGLSYALKWNDLEASDRNKASVKGKFDFKSSSEFTHRITESNIRINDTLWKVDRGNSISVSDSAITFSKFAVFSDYQRVLLEGTISDNPEHNFRIGFDEFNLSGLDVLYAASDMDVDGTLNGYMDFSKLSGRMKYTGNISVEDLYLNNQKMGDASFYSNWVDSTQQLNIRGDIVYSGSAGERTLLQLEGDYWPRPGQPEDSLFFVSELNNFSVKALYPFLDDFLEDIDGMASGTLSLKGSTQKPELTGGVNLTRSSLKLTYLNTTYHLADKIKLRSNAIVFDSIQMYDSKGNSAVLNGSVNHRYFNDFELDLHINTSNFAALNTTRVDNDLFYGDAFATGRIDVTGPVDDINMNVNARTESDTRVVIPISTAESVMENDFIVFMKDDESEEEKSLTFKKASFGGLNMNFELDITPEAQAEIILPFSMGRITGRGGGNLKMEITSAGEFNMYGDYIIEEGSFLFSLQNMLRRDFSIQRGGTISWNGNPYNADLNITALYRVRPTLKGLPAAGSIDPALANERIPVNCIINLKDKLFNPNIRFDISLPTSDARVKEIVYSSIDTTNRAEMNRQMLYLLVLNSFSVREMDNTFTTGLGASSLDLLSNQISSWLSQISKDFDIGINYRPGDTYTSEELEVALSTQLFNDRVLVDGNFGVTNMQEQTQTSNIVGDIDIEIKVTKDGRFRVKVFNETNNVDLLNVGAPYTQGIGVFYRKEFDNLNELFRKKVKEDAMTN